MFQCQSALPRQYYWSGVKEEVAGKSMSRTTETVFWRQQERIAFWKQYTYSLQIEFDVQ